MKRPKQMIWMLAIGILAAISGCSNTPSTAVPAEAMTAKDPLTPPPYLIQPGDNLDIKFFLQPRVERIRNRPA